MAQFKSEFLNILFERGFVHQCSDENGLDEQLSSGTRAAYIGFDCTASSLHVGSLVQIMKLHWFQKTGHKPVALMGGGTTHVGDPSGKDESRQLLTSDKINENKEGIAQVFSSFMTFGDGPTDGIMPDNAEWLLELKYVDLLRDVGRHFSVNQMLARDAVKLRLDRDQHLSFLEFNYMILQGYDFVELNRRHDCILQMGGSDQWGNILSGVDLGRRMEGADLYALTSPLITTSSGAKMGKTAAGAVWLNADMTSPYDYWQFWRNTEDADVDRFLKLFTDLPLDEIARLEALEGAELNEAKKTLANEATAMLHGRATADEVAETARKTFEEGQTVASLPSVEIGSSDLTAGLGVLEAVVRTGLAQSNGEVRRHIKGGAIRINDKAISDANLMLGDNDLIAGAIKVSIGKKKHMLLKVV